MLPPEIKPPYPLEVRQQCLELYRQEYSFEKIQELTGVTNRQTLRGWIRKAGELKKASDYSQAQRQHYVNLYVEGMSLSQIESLAGVPADLLNRWIHAAGVSRPRKIYSHQLKQRVFALYKEGRTPEEIEALTGINAQSVQSLMKKAKLYRPRPRRYGGGRPLIHSLEVKQSCQKLLQEGKSPAQIEELLGVSADTVRQWRKQWEQTAQVLSPENKPNIPDEASQPG